MSVFFPHLAQYSVQIFPIVYVWQSSYLEESYTMKYVQFIQGNQLEFKSNFSKHAWQNMFGFFYKSISLEYWNSFLD